MRILNSFKIAWRAIILNKSRTLLTMLGMIIGVGSVITMMAIGQGSKESIRTQISSMGSNMITISPGAGMRGGVITSGENMNKLTFNDLEAIKSEVKGISKIVPVVNSSGQTIYGSKNWPTTIYGTYPDYFEIRMLDIKSGSSFTMEDVEASAKVAVVGQTVVDNLFSKDENPIGKMIRFQRIPLKIIGVLVEKGENTFGQDQDNLILSPFNTVQRRVIGNDYLHSIIASTWTENDANGAVTDITDVLRRTHELQEDEEDDFNVFAMEELIKTLSSTSEMLTLLLVVIAGISLLVGGIGIMNIMYVSVKERTREIGLRMAVGAQSSAILMQFLIEAILISFTGGVLGVIFGFTSIFAVQQLLNWPAIISVDSILISFVVCAFTGIFFGWYPARKAAQLDPLQALRYE